MKKISEILIGLLMSVVLIAAIGLGILGMVLPEWFTSTNVVLGSYRIEPMETGLAIFQYGRTSPFYGTSVLNDYVVDGFGSRTPILLKDDYDQKRFTTNQHQWGYKKIRNTIEAYLGLRGISWEMENDRVRVEYKAENIGNGVKVTKRIDNGFSVAIKEVSTTLTYNANDVVFDLDTGTILSKSSPQIVADVQKYYGINLNQLVQLDPVLKINHGVGIVNPSIPGHLTVEKMVDNQEMLVDREFQLIQVQEPYQKGIWLWGIKIRGIKMEEK